MKISGFDCNPDKHSGMGYNYGREGYYDKAVGNGSCRWA